jgi:hypothetical protein
LFSHFYRLYRRPQNLSANGTPRRAMTAMELPAAEGSRAFVTMPAEE